MGAFGRILRGRLGSGNTRYRADHCRDSHLPFTWPEAASFLGRYRASQLVLRVCAGSPVRL